MGDLCFENVDPQSESALNSMRSYFGELDQRFSHGFDPGDTLNADADHFREPQGRFIVATANGVTTGCGGVQLLSPNIAEIKRMWIAAEQRGRGFGGQLLGHLEVVAGELGATTVRLDTNSVLDEAIAMYTGRGYVDIAPYNDNPYAHRWFEKSLKQGGHPD